LILLSIDDFPPLISPGLSEQLVIELESGLVPEKIDGFVQQGFSVRKELLASGICDQMSFTFLIARAVLWSSQKK
jgi:hypothetical protein